MKKIVCLALALILVWGCALEALCAEEALEEVRCEEQGFSTKIPAGLTAEWSEGNGLQISMGKPGYIPFILVFRRPKKLSNPVNYLNNVVREYMENSYGSNMIGTNPCKTQEIGGKKLYAARYYYKVQNTRVCLMRLVEVREDGDVEYTAKYVDGKGDETLAALEIAVQYYQADPAETKAP